jgi:asparagine N-glycosylation enzyme membrane subunit Stt3
VDLDIDLVMQSVRRPFDRVTSDKPKLFIIISLLTVSILAIPAILPHLTHTHMIYHILLHVTSLDIAIFLAIVAISAYLRNKSNRLLFMSLGFASLVIVEVFYLFYSTGGIHSIMIDIVEIELTHIILFGMLTLFGIGIFKVNSK